MAAGTTPDPRIAARQRHPAWRPDVSARLHLRHAHPRSHSSTERHARPQSLSPPGRRKIEFLAGTAESREISEGVVLDYDSAGNLVGIDIDNASTKVQMDTLTLSKLPGRVETIAG